jgi:hypothetical protein
MMHVTPSLCSSSCAKGEEGLEEAGDSSSFQKSCFRAISRRFRGSDCDSGDDEEEEEEEEEEDDDDDNDNDGDGREDEDEDLAVVVVTDRREQARNPISTLNLQPLQAPQGFHVLLLLVLLLVLLLLLLLLLVMLLLLLLLLTWTISGQVI